MSALRAVLLASLVVGWAVVPLLGAPPVAAADVGIESNVLSQSQVDESESSTNTTENATEQSFGAQISGFMQQQTSQAGGAVESGMWGAAFDNTSNETARASLVSERTDGLRNQLLSVHAERQELLDAKKAGEIGDLEFRSRMSGLVGRYASVLAAINETEPRAAATGANVSAVRELRGAARTVVGPQLSATAGNGPGTVPGLTNNSSVGPPTSIPGLNGTVGQDNESAFPGNGNGNGNGNGVANENGNGPPVSVPGTDNSTEPGVDVSNPLPAVGRNISLYPGLLELKLVDAP